MRLYGHSQTLDNFYWYGRGSLALIADSSIPPHILQRAGHSAVVLGGKVLISGGLTAWPTDKLELFIVDMGSWSMKRYTHTPRPSPSATVSRLPKAHDARVCSEVASIV